MCDIQSAVDVPAGASGFKDDVSPEHSVTTTSCSDNYDTGEFYYLARECGVRTSSNASSSNNSRHSSTSSGVDQQNVQHNHTYPLAPGQRSRSEREKEAQQDRDERASRSRDEKKAKDMQVDCMPYSHIQLDCTAHGHMQASSIAHSTYPQHFQLSP